MRYANATPKLPEQKPVMELLMTNTKAHCVKELSEYFKLAKYSEIMPGLSISSSSGHSTLRLSNDSQEAPYFQSTNVLNCVNLRHCNMVEMIHYY